MHEDRREMRVECRWRGDGGGVNVYGGAVRGGMGERWESVVVGMMKDVQ